MKPLYASCLVLTGVLAGVTTAWAQAHDHPPGDPQQLGVAVFPTSCAAGVHDEFNRAVAMLHSFWYQTSEKAFARVAQEDPKCAMAYWGVAMSRFHPLWEKPNTEDLHVGQAALEQARTAGAKTERERDYINALSQFYHDAERVDHLLRMEAYEGAMAALFERYPDDSEAAIFYALAVLGVAYSSPRDSTYARQKQAGAVLERIFARQPNHPGVAHYIIHSYDFPSLAGRALEAARRYAKIAPDAPHALHMPSHIFTRLGLWQESITSNQAAATAARKDQWMGEELHASDYLVYAFLQGAQDAEARSIWQAMPTLRDGIPSYFAGVYATAAIPARYALERRQWTEAAALTVPEGVFPGGTSCWAETTLHLSRGLGAVHTGKLADARRSLESLTNCREVLRQRHEELWADQVEVQRRAVAAWMALAEGHPDRAVAMMRSAAELEANTDKHPVTPGAVVPARELLGEMLLELNRPREAMLAFEATLEDAPNRFRSLYGAARAAARTGDDERASRYYTKLLDISRLADTVRPEVREAEHFLRQREPR